MADETSSDYNLFVLRRLFNKDRAGKGTQGEVRRESLHTTVTPLTMHILSTVVPTGKGKFSAPVVELGIRLQLAMLGKISTKTIAEELAVSVIDRNEASTRLHVIADLIKQYRPE